MQELQGYELHEPILYCGKILRVCKCDHFLKTRLFSLNRLKYTEINQPTANKTDCQICFIGNKKTSAAHIF